MSACKGVGMNLCKWRGRCCVSAYVSVCGSEVCECVYVHLGVCVVKV